MVTAVMNDKIKKGLKEFFKREKNPELLETYLHYLGLKEKISPVLFPQEKRIYQSIDQLMEHLEKEGKLWRETEIKVQFGRQNVNAETKKIYICPFTGKAFGDNTCLNPQDAIYDWVSKCPENTERVGGMRVKRFYVSEDPKVIAEYVQERSEPIIKKVFSSAVTGKLFNSKEDVIKDFKANHTRAMTFVEVQSQNRFEIEEGFLAFCQEALGQEKVAEFVEMMAAEKEFEPFISDWFEE